MSATVAGHALHVVARVALRVATPLRAKRIVDLAALATRRFMPLGNADSARVVASALDGHGTCLSRALTVAALLPGAEVVIGVDPRVRRPLYAHAWVEHGGRALRGADVSGAEIARLANATRERETPRSRC